MRSLTILLLAGLFSVVWLTEPQVQAQESDPELAQSLKRGLRVFKIHCQSCHAKNGDHPDPLFNLADGVWRFGGTLEEIEKTVSEGVPGTAMLGFANRLSKKKLKDVVLLVKSFEPEADSEDR